MGKLKTFSSNNLKVDSVTLLTTSYPPFESFDRLLSKPRLPMGIKQCSLFLKKVAALDFNINIERFTKNQHSRELKTT